jgi:hypothetical protein
MTILEASKFSDMDRGCRTTQNSHWRLQCSYTTEYLISRVLSIYLHRQGNNDTTSESPLTHPPFFLPPQLPETHLSLCALLSSFTVYFSPPVFASGLPLLLLLWLRLMTKVMSVVDPVELVPGTQHTTEEEVFSDIATTTLSPKFAHQAVVAP